MRTKNSSKYGLKVHTLGLKTIKILPNLTEFDNEQWKKAVDCWYV
jgi:hypothetical protein